MSENKEAAKIDLLSSVPVKKAVPALAAPTVLSQIIVVLYNTADTFFIGQIGSPLQVAAATLCLPTFFTLTGFSNLFGIGGASFISRALGKKDPMSAKAAASFCLWASSVIALIFGFMIHMLSPVLLPVIGADESTYALCREYLFWTTFAGAVPTVFGNVTSNLVRAEGYSREAGLGIMLGGLVNIGLDPAFIFGLGLELKGAAVATFLSNCLSSLFFILFLCIKRKSTVITAAPGYCLKLNGAIVKEVLLVGFPSFCMTLLSLLSNTVLNKLISSYSTEAIAGMGIAKKIDMIAMAIANGMAQGSLALIAYNYAAGNRKRMKEAIRVTSVYTMAMALLGMVLLLCFAAPVARLFINDEQTVWHGQFFLRIIAFACPFLSINMLSITFFQAIGRKSPAFLLTFCRKGTLDVLTMLVLNSAVGLRGIAWGTPVAEFSTAIIALLVLRRAVKDVFREE